MFGENWSRGSPDRRRTWSGRGRGARRAPARSGAYPRGYRKPENAPRGRMSAYAFFIQTCREEYKQQFPHQRIVFKDFSRKCADRWKTLTSAEKQHFSDMATQDRARYAKELQSYRGPRIRNRRRKTRKDPRAPKRALSAFFWFCSDERPKVREANPGASVGKVARELGALWAAAEAAVKDRYEKMAVQDKLRYEQQMAEYKEGNFSRHVEGMEDLPPPDPNNLGKLPNVKRYTYLPRLPHPRYLGHTVGANGSPTNEDEEDDEGMEDEDDKDEEIEEEEDDKDEEEEDEEDGEEHSNTEEDEMVSDEEMEDNDSVIEDNMPDRGLPPPDGP